MKQTHNNFLLLPPSRSSQTNSGFTLIEILIAIGLFLIIAFGIYFTYANLIQVIGRVRTHTLATSILNKEIEIIRNLPFDSVGLIGGSPPGVIAPSKDITYEGQQFTIDAFVRNIDDPFDGKLGQNPNDTAPADYRLVEIKVDCSTCFQFVPVWFTTWVAPQNLESSTQNGSLFINVFDANGKPVSNANVLVRNTSTTPSITINDTTNNSGTLQLVDIPTSTDAYQITITKQNYSSAQTYSPGVPSNPNPIQPHATVASQAITAISFGIDRVGVISAQTQDYLCQAIPSVSFNQIGTKLIGANPNVPAYSSSFTTDSSGSSLIGNLGWDTYSFTNTSASYDLAGSIPLVPLTINPGNILSLTFVMEPQASNSLLVTVVNASGTPIGDAAVNIAKTGFNDSKLTGQRPFFETDWSLDGSYDSQDGNLDVSETGTVKLQRSNGSYPTSTESYLISNSIDVGTSTTAWHAISWGPASQPTNTSLKFQLASNNDDSTWNYVGPDNTAGTYYTSPGSIGTMHNGNRYLRYKAYLNTTDDTATPNFDDITLNFSSGCIPTGQAFWSAFPTGTYTVTAAKTGYITATSSVIVGSGWHETRLILQ